MNAAAYISEIHANHVRLGFHSGGCDLCRAPDPRPEPTSWWLDARAGRLRPAIVGGVPITDHDARPEVPDQVLSRDEPRSSLVPELDVSAHRGRPDRIPVRSGD